MIAATRAVMQQYGEAEVIL